jgi:hypothetical protein
MRKQAKKHFFASSEKILLRKLWHFFASVSLHFTSKRKLCQFFACVLLHFASKRKLWQFFASFSFCFRFVPFSFCFRFLRFTSMRNKQKKALFFALKQTKFCFRFTSFRFEAKMTAHLRYTLQPSVGGGSMPIVVY